MRLLRADRDLERCETCAVVDERLALERRRESLRRTQTANDRSGSDGIRGAQHGAQGERRDPRETCHQAGQILPYADRGHQVTQRLEAMLGDLATVAPPEQWGAIASWSSSIVRARAGDADPRAEAAAEA